MPLPLDVSFRMQLTPFEPQMYARPSTMQTQCEKPAESGELFLIVIAN